jgi:hypothetical protein
MTKFKTNGSIQNHKKRTIYSLINKQNHGTYCNTIAAGKRQTGSRNRSDHQRLETATALPRRAFYWEDCETPTIERAECIKHLLQGYDQDWSLYFTGSPTDEFVPITFVKRDELKHQRELMLA